MDSLVSPDTVSMQETVRSSSITVFSFRILNSPILFILQSCLCRDVKLQACHLLQVQSVSRSNSGSGCGSVVQSRTLRSQHSPENAARERSRVRNLRQAFHSLQVGKRKAVSVISYFHIVCWFCRVTSRTYKSCNVNKNLSHKTNLRSIFVLNMSKIIF